MEPEVRARLMGRVEAEIGSDSFYVLAVMEPNDETGKLNVDLLTDIEDIPTLVEALALITARVPAAPAADYTGPRGAPVLKKDS
jgi:hypothetical protein